MLRHSIKLLCDGCVTLTKANVSTGPGKWELLTAVCLERKPTLAALPNELENKFGQMLADIEHEKSYKADHEIRHELDLKQAELIKKGDVDVDSDFTIKETGQDFEDAGVLELQQFKFGSKITNADKSNDVKSLNRKLDKHLILLVNQTIGGQQYYLLPQGLRQDGESLRQTAERVLKESCPTVKAQFFGNAPVGFYKYKYPKDVQEKIGSVGAKVFIYFAKYDKGEFPAKGVDYKWLDRVELKKELPNVYHQSVAPFLIDD